MFLYWLAADMPALRNSAEELMWFAAQKDLQESLAWAYYFRGCAHYMQNDAPAAADDFLAVISRRHIASSFVFVQSAFGLASALFAQTKQDEAQAVIELLAEYAQEPGNAAVRGMAQACAAGVAYRHDNREEALRWVAKTERSFQRRPLIGLCAAPLVTTLVLIGQGTPAALLEAEQLLSEEDVFLAETHDRMARIEVLVQLAELHVSMNRHEAALLAMREAVELAQPGGVRRVFLDASRVVRDLLDELEFTGVHQRFIEELRVHSPRDNAMQEPAQRMPQATAAARDFVQPRHPDLIELLTNREMEVLQLLAMRMTNKEIAQALGISTDTVKQHAMNVFRKLHVDNRRAAVLQARAMGFQFDNQTML
ncbi:MAG: hypothetical protein IPK16_28300 [Anaerolineales bacterium]|nr:hypothetical protein [Anaerolineales bacterium]